MASKSKKTSGKGKRVELVAGEGRNRFASGTQHGVLSPEQGKAASAGKIKLGANVTLYGGKAYSVRTGDGYTSWGVAEGTAGHSIQHAVWFCGVGPKGTFLPFTKKQLIETMADWLCEPVRSDEPTRYNVGGQCSNFLHRELIAKSGKGSYTITEKGWQLMRESGEYTTFLKLPRFIRPAKSGK